MSKRNKANAAEKEARVNKVYDLLITGVNRAGILQYVATKTDWNITPRMVDNYIADANAQLASEAEYHKARELSKAIARMNTVITMSFKAGDTQRIIQAQHQLNLLMGNYAPKMLELRGMEAAALNDLLDQLKAIGIPASEVFNAMLEIVATEKAEKG